ncbi:MAG: hypothetical protein JRH10_22290 [Deltaproteobacteria bacterium]|nr:hypothetical protein [Deltaproteobacteria bacterium]MBW2447127.1 hypothetical protein [Deltaproteobacteria bacterium]
MNWLVAAFGLFLFVIGLYGMVSPEPVLRVLRGWSPSQRLGIAVGGRAVLGVIFLLAADSTRHPGLITAIGVIALLAAALMPLFGAQRISAMFDWFLDRPPPLLRAWFVAAVIFGAGLVWVALPA